MQEAEEWEAKGGERRGPLMEGRRKRSSNWRADRRKEGKIRKEVRRGGERRKTGEMPGS